MNTTLQTVYPDVDSAAVNWSDITEGQGSWDDCNILRLCKDGRAYLNSSESYASKCGYLKAIIFCIEQTIKAKAER